MNTLQIFGPTFSTKIDRPKIFRCSSDTYKALEKWFGFDALLRMEFRSGWIHGLLFGGVLVYNALRLLLNSDWTSWAVFNFLWGLILITTGTLGRFRPNRSLPLFYSCAWILLVFRSFYGLFMNNHWSNHFIIFFSIFSIYLLIYRYTRLGNLPRAT